MACGHLSLSLQGTAGHGSLGSWPWLLLWRHSHDWDHGQWEACHRRVGLARAVCAASTCLEADCVFVATRVSKPSLSQKTAPCLGRTFPALVIFLLFYPDCTCANKLLTAAKPHSAGSAGLCARSTAHPGLSHLPQIGCSGAGGDKPCSKLFVQGLLPKEGGPAETLLVCLGCRQPTAHPGTVASADGRGWELPAHIWVSSEPQARAGS